MRKSSAERGGSLASLPSGVAELGFSASLDDMVVENERMVG